MGPGRHRRIGRARPRAQLNQRLANATARIADQVKAGADPQALLGWVSYWAAGRRQRSSPGRSDVADQVSTTHQVLGRVMGIAEPGACQYCRTLATRGPVYRSKATAVASRRGHCRCDVVTVTDPVAVLDLRGRRGAGLGGPWACPSAPARSSSAPARPGSDSTRPCSGPTPARLNGWCRSGCRSASTPATCPT